MEWNAECNGMGWDGMGWYGMEWNGMFHGMEWDGFWMSCGTIAEVV